MVGDVLVPPAAASGLIDEDDEAVAVAEVVPELLLDVALIVCGNILVTIEARPPYSAGPASKTLARS